MRLVAKKSAVSRTGGFEAWLRENFPLRDDVSLERIKDGGMYGNRVFIWSVPTGVDPTGQIKCRGYFSSGIVQTCKMSADLRLFECDYDELKEYRSNADNGFDH